MTIAQQESQLHMLRIPRQMRECLHTKHYAIRAAQARNLKLSLSQNNNENIDMYNTNLNSLTVHCCSLSWKF